MRDEWLKKHPEPTDPGKPGTKGQWRYYREAHAAWIDSIPEYFDVGEAKAAQIRSEFLELWDGSLSPAAWLSWRLWRGEVPMRSMCALPYKVRTCVPQMLARMPTHVHVLTHARVDRSILVSPSSSRERR